MQNQVAEEKQTAREIKIILVVFVFGIFISYIINELYGKQYYKLSARINAISLYMLISAMIGRVMWNNYIIELFPFAKPAPGFEYILGLMIFTGMVLKF